MIISDTTLTLTRPDSLAEMFEAYQRYRTALEVMATAFSHYEQHQLLRDLVQLRDRYLVTMKSVTSDDERGVRYGAYQRYLLHIKKTIAGLVQLILRHAVRKPRPSQPPFSLFYRVRQITVTHPAIAPPQFA